MEQGAYQGMEKPGKLIWDPPHLPSIVLSGTLEICLAQRDHQHLKQHPSGQRESMD